jgi:hypothetical protein
MGHHGGVDEYGRALAEAIEEAVPGWVEQAVERTLLAAGSRPDAVVSERAVRAGRQAQAEVASRVRALLVADIDEQHTTPLAILRDAVRYPTGVLRDAGAAPVVRDADQQRLFPDDVYDLSPASFADIGPAVAEAGLVWGAAKAHTHLQRHARPAEPRP